MGTEATETPSRVLYVAGVGQQMNTLKTDVLAEFAAFGAVEEVEFVANKRFCFVVFEDAHSATAAMEALSDRHIERFKGRVFIQYAVENAPRSPGPPEPECVSLTAEVVVPGLEVLEEFVSEEDEQILLSDEYAGPNAPHWKESLSRRVHVLPLSRRCHVSNCTLIVCSTMGSPSTTARCCSTTTPTALLPSPRYTPTWRDT